MMARPVFVDGAIIGFAVVRGHWTDIGGMGAGSYTAVTTDPIQEGLRIPPIKLYRRGVLEQSYVDLILANVRVPRDRLGDIRAEYAGCITARAQASGTHYQVWNPHGSGLHAGDPGAW